MFTQKSLSVVVLASLSLMSSCSKDLEQIAEVRYQKCTRAKMNAALGVADRTLAAPGPVKPIFEREKSCYFPQSRSCSLSYAYNNTASETKTIPHGPENHFHNPSGSTCDGNCGQTTTFMPGYVTRAVTLHTTDFGALEHVWKLDGNTAAGVCNPSLPTCSVLPLRDLKILGAKFDGTNTLRLKFQSKGEIAVKEYRVQMSAKCSTTTDVIVQTIPAKGNSSHETDQTYVSAPIYFGLDQGGDYAFRVVSVDFDGKVSYSPYFIFGVGVGGSNSSNF